MALLCLVRDRVAKMRQTVDLVDVEEIAVEEIDDRIALLAVLLVVGRQRDNRFDVVGSPSRLPSSDLP